MNLFKTLTALFVLSFLAFTSQAQGVCDNLAPENRGNFDIIGGGCAPVNIEVKDLSGGTELKYDFDYKGQLPPNLNVKNFTNDTYGAPGTYTILQTGVKDGKAIYACKQVVVRTDNKPDYSYSICNLDLIEINIPKSAGNNFDSYEIDWGGGQIQKIKKEDLPFNINRRLNASRTFRVQGIFSSGVSNCSTPPFITVPVYVPGNFPNGYDKPFHPNIEKLELTSADQVELTFKGAFEGGGYDLFMTKQGSNYPSIPLKKGLKPGSITLDLPDSLSSYCFYLNRYMPNCGNEPSAEICTLVLKEVDVEEKKNIIHWIKYPENIMTGIIIDPKYGCYLNRNENLVTSENGTISNIPLINHNGIYTYDVGCKDEVCYQIVVETSGQLYYNAFSGKSVSKEICINLEDFKPPAITELYTSVNNQQLVEIKFSDVSPIKDPYLLYRKQNHGFTLIEPLNTIGTFTDAKVSVKDSSYCYTVGYKDECGRESHPSPEVCTIHLSDSLSSLNWSSASPFSPGDLIEYVIEDSLSDVATLEPDITSFTPDLTNYDDKVTFRIKSTDSIGNISYSNFIEIYPKFSIYLPNIFTPNGDGNNEVLMLKGSMKVIKDVLVEIYDRWGIKLITFDNKDFVWDGTINGKRLDSGIYQIKVNGKFTNDKVFSYKNALYILY